MLTRTQRLTSRRLALAAILLLGLVLRLQHLRAPLVEAHSWRQVDTAAIARNMSEGGLNPFYPEVNWGGPHGYVECEFPLLPFLAAVLYRLIGPWDWLGRLVTIAFSVGTIAVVYRLASRMFDPPAARAAAFLVAVSPAAIFFGRTFMPDSAMLFFMVAAVAGFVEHLQTGRVRPLVWGSVALAFAGLVKIPGVLVLGALAGATWHARGWRAIGDRRLIAALVLPLVVVGAWYWHAHELFKETGITFGILGQAAKMYPLTISAGPWTSTFSKWSTAAVLTDFGLYERLFARVYSFHLLPWGVMGAAIGLLMWVRRAWFAVPALWLLALTAFVVAAAEGHRAHDYYQLVFVPVGALCFGVAAARLFDGEWIRQHVPLRRFAPVVAGTLLTVLALVSVHYSGVEESHFRVNGLDTRTLRAGDVLRRVVPQGEMIAVVDDYGVTSPLLLYYAHARGWSFDVANVTPALLQHLSRRFGVRYFATTVLFELQAAQPETMVYLRQMRAVELTGHPEGMAVFELQP